MEFKKYPSIENSYRQKYIDIINMNGFGDDTRWYVEEKIHGSNLFICTDGNDIKIGKRTSFLSPEELEKFYRADIVLKENEDKIKELFNQIKSVLKNVVDIKLYGEVFGGYYGHPDVPRDVNSIRVQKGVDYTPKNNFIAFDMTINDEFWLDVDTMKALFRSFDVFHTPTLFEGTLEECLSYPNIFQTTIPKMFGLPEIEKNICEGVVLKPCIPSFIGESRVILKNKNEKFTEKSREKKRQPAIKKNVTKEQENMLNIAMEYINENRYNNVVSKLGNVTIKDFSTVLKSMVLDVLDDLHKDHGEEINTLLDKQEIKWLNKNIQQECVKIIKTRI